jgi:hypothetical protein
MLQGGSEDFYHDELGKEVTGFHPSTHNVIGTLGEGNQRIRNQEKATLPDGFPKFGPAYSGPLARPQPYSGPMARPSGDKPLELGSLMRGGAPSPASNPAAVANGVRANAAMPQQLSIADQQAADIRKRGGMTAADQTAQDIDFGNQMYNKANPNAPVGSLAAREAALARIRPNVLQASGLYEYKDKNGQMNFAGTSPDAMNPMTRQTHREGAYQKHFGQEDGPWVGDNPMTGKYKDPNEGDIWDSADAYRQSGMAPTYLNGLKNGEYQAPQFGMSGMTPEQMNASIDNTMATNVRMHSQLRDNVLQSLNNEAPANAIRSSAYAKETAPLRARVKSLGEGDNSLEGVTSSQYNDPSFTHRMKGPMDDNGNPSGYGSADPSAGYRPVGTDPRYDQNMNLPSLQGDVSDGQTIDGILNGQQAKRDASVFNKRQGVIDYLRTRPQFSQGDSEPSANGNYTNPRLIRRRRK